MTKADVKDTGTVTTPTVDAATGASRPNNNNSLRKLVLLYGGSGVSLAGLGTAVDAFLQPAAVSVR